MTAVHYVILGAEFALGFIGCWCVIIVLAGLFAAGRADDASERYAQERRIKIDG
jgi:hypothetical protein